MKRTLLISIFCLSCVGLLSAQERVHSWKMGPLSWNDFVHKSAIDGRVSELEYYMSIRSTDKKVDGVKYVKPEVYMYMSPDYSWADTNYRTPELLQYNQCAFDLAEVYRRQLQERLRNYEVGADQYMLLDRTMSNLAQDIRRLEVEVREGSDSVALHKWQSNISKMLADTKEVDVYGFENAPWRWNFTFDLGFSGTCGQLHDYFSNFFVIGNTFDVAYRHHFFSFAWSIGLGKARDYMFLSDHAGDSNWAFFPNDKLDQLDLYCSYGYSVFDNNYFRLVPFVGYGLQHYSFDAETVNPFGPTVGCFHFGVDFHRYFYNAVYAGSNDANDEFNGEHDHFSYHVKLFGTYNNMKSVVGVPTGFTLNLQLGIAIMGCRAKVK